MKCHQCGFELPEIAKFCLSCGVKQDQALTESIDTQPTIATPPLSETSLPQINLAVPQVSLSEFPTPAPIDAPQLHEVAPQATSSTEMPPPASQNPSSAPSSPPVPSVLRSRTFIYAVIGVFVIVVVYGLGYWRGTQKKAIDEPSAVIVKQQTEEQQRKAKEEQQQKLKEAEEKSRKETGEKANEKTNEPIKKEGETPENCIEREMIKWEIQRANEISEWCDDLAKKGKECKISASAEEALTEEALNKITAQCR